ncbi:MAG: [FeFe] hydrogenase H-cluster radical SAM maturase HydE, partial [Clostridiales bacterium]|nr:[FeFe] hydrogenase H-cluster radical SAM maturase HydE [Clostridiales bacterium]
MKELIDKLYKQNTLHKDELCALLDNLTAENAPYLFEKARSVADKNFGNRIYVRGLIEFTNYCKNDCFYCGIRKSNRNAQRYRLTKEEILSCCENGYSLGFRTFVLQGGEDPFFTDDKIADLVFSIKKAYPDCAVTLSVGERSRESYARLRAAGADRYLLRHETADAGHFAKIHPGELSLEQRIRCLRDLKELGYQVGCGFMVGSPYQTIDSIVADLEFIKEFQ